MGASAESGGRIRWLVDNDAGLDGVFALVHLCACGHVENAAVPSVQGDVGTHQVAVSDRALPGPCAKLDLPVLIGAREPLEIALVATEEARGAEGVPLCILSSNFEHRSIVKRPVANHCE